MNFSLVSTTETKTLKGSLVIDISELVKAHSAYTETIEDMESWLVHILNNKQLLNMLADEYVTTSSQVEYAFTTAVDIDILKRLASLM